AGHRGYVLRRAAVLHPRSQRLPAVLHWSPPLVIVIYAAAKFTAYVGWCYLALRLVEPTAASLSSALQLGAPRWLRGLAFGVAVFFFVGSIDAADAARTYFLVYSPVRAVEWAIMAAVIASRVQTPLRSTSMRLPLWCLGGMVVSFLTDLLSPEGLQG